MEKVVKALIKYKKIIIISILLVVSLILLSSFVYLISIEDGTYNEDDWANTPYVVSNYTNSAQIGSDGITTEKTKDEIWNSLIAEGSNVSKYLDSSDELQKLMNAELVTQYPKIDGADEDSVNGIIEFQRNKTDGTKITLKYMDRDKFEENIDSGVEKLSDGTSILDYFTLDTSGNVEIAVVNTETYEVKSGDENFDINSLKNDGIEYGGLSEEDKISGDKYYNSEYLKIERNITKKTINYKSVVDKYTMPFQYLWALLVIGEDKDFVLELADLVEESEIIISIYDNVTTTTYEDTYEYTESKEINKNITVRVNDPNSGKVKKYQDYSTSYGPSTSDTTYSAYITRKYESNTVNVDLTKADVWMVDYSKEYSYQSEETTTDDEEKRDLNDIEGVSSIYDSNITITLLGDSDAVAYAKTMRDEYILKNYSNQSSSLTTNYEIEQEVRRVVIDIKVNKINRSVSTKTTTVEQNYVEGDVVNEPKVSQKASDDKENFVSLLCKKEHKDAKNRICSEVTDWFIEILENNPDTVNMVDLTKYLLYKATGTDYGVTDYDFSAYEESNFNSINTSVTDQLIRYIHQWENASGPKTNADGTMYIVEDDGAGHPTVGYGVDIENGGYKSKFEEAGYSTKIGDAIPIDFVDSIERMEIENKSTYIKTKTSGLGLTDYQINALISRAYNCGNSGALQERNGKTFMQAYTEYWNQETDDQYEEKNSTADYTNLLYTQYMSVPVTSDNVYLAGLENRRKSEWTLFQTGYYDKLKEWHIEMGDSIVETAKIIHEYMEQKKYSYCVYGGNDYEECGKDTANGSKHGLSITFEKSKTEYRHSCCATYVSWVLQECGYLDDSEHTDGANDLQSKLISKGWTRISSVSELQPGDVLCYNHHVEIYAGDNKVYNAGSGKTIRKASPSKRSKTFSYALRAPN